MNAPQSATSFVIRDQNKPRGALILGGAHGSLAIARSLSRQGIPVYLLSHDNPIARFSRHVNRNLRWSGPETAVALAELLDLAERHQMHGWMIFVGADAELRFVAENHATLSAFFRLTTLPWETIKWTYDKRLVHQNAQSAGIDSPRSYYPSDAQALTKIDCRFPVILKPRVHEGDNAFTLAKAWRANDRNALLSRYQQAAAATGGNLIVVQEFIGGGGENQFSYAAVWDRGAPVASLVARRLRQYPVDFGYTSTYVETLEQKEIEALACRFLRPLDFSGLVEIEFKYDTQDARYKILDVNARAWTWIALGELAGVDFPHLLWRAVFGEKIAAIRGCSGKTWMYFSRDAVAAFLGVWKGTLTVRNYLQAFRKPIVFTAFATDDPLPGLIDLPLVIFRVACKRLPKVWGSLKCAHKAAH